MLNVKKVGALGLAVFASAAFMSSAKAEYFRVSDFKTGTTILKKTGDVLPQIIELEDSDMGGWKVGYIYLADTVQYQTGYNDQTDLNFLIKGYELEDNKDYTVYIDNTPLEEKHTGAELMQGIVFHVTGRGGKLRLKVKETSTNIQVNYGVYKCDNVPECSEEDGIKLDTNNERVTYPLVRIDLPDLNNTGGNQYQYVPTEDEVANMDAVYEAISNNGVIKVNSINPYKSNVDEYLEDSLISAALLSQYSSYGYTFFAYADENGEGDLQIVYEDGTKAYSKSYEAKYEFIAIDENIKKITDEISELIKQDRSTVLNDFDKRYIIEDLDSINYYYSSQKAKNIMFYYYSMPSFSTKLQEKIENKNIDFIFDPRAGDNDSQFHYGVLGPVNVLYNGQVYSNVDPVGFSLNNIIYIDSDTEKNDDAFIAAAKARIQGYLKGVEVEITPIGLIEDLDEIDYSWVKASTDPNMGGDLVPLFDLDKTTGSAYLITIGEEEYPYFIVADSEKQITPKVKTMDVFSNVYLTTDTFETPLDSKIRAEKLDKNSEEYKALAKKLNIIDGLAYDLNLYSNSLDMYIEKLENGKFKVYIPISEATSKRNLTAVYVKEDGTLEKHPITISEDGKYAIFETDHFSKYSIVDSKNPQTGDYIGLYILIFSGAAYTLYKVRKFN